MFYYTLYFSSLIYSTLFCFMQHPLAMGMMLLIQTILICLLTGSASKTFWFSYILFLIFLGGMLVLFIYVISLSSNEMFSFSLKMMSLSFVILIAFLILISLTDNSLMMTYMMNWDSMTNMASKNLPNSYSDMLNKLYNFPTNLVTFLLMSYLFLTLVAIVKITNVFEGPLRPRS